MHKNHRRKNKYNPGRPRWWTHLTYWKKWYWSRERAREKHLIIHDRFDDCQTKHPKSILWDAL